MSIAVKNLVSHLSLAIFLRIVWPPALVFATHVVFTYGFHLYQLIPPIDIPMHYLGGLSMAYSCFLALAFLQQHKIISPLDQIVTWVLVFTAIATIAVFWEFGEFTMDQLLHTNAQISLANTMQDMLMGILGATTMIGYKIVRRSK